MKLIIRWKGCLSCLERVCFRRVGHSPKARTLTSRGSHLALCHVCSSNILVCCDVTRVLTQRPTERTPTHWNLPHRCHFNKDSLLGFSASCRSHDFLFLRETRALCCGVITARLHTNTPPSSLAHTHTSVSTGTCTKTEVE